MSLRSRQSRFVKMKALLIQYAELHGIELTDGDAYRDDRCMYGHKKSLHRKRLAQDFNAFPQNGQAGPFDKKAHKAHMMLHDFWEFIGGNERILEDLNHYSYSDGVSDMR